MVDQQIIDNINKELKSGEPKDKIVRMLQIQGYAQGDIDAAFAAIENPSLAATIPVSPSVPTPAPVADPIPAPAPISTPAPAPVATSAPALGSTPTFVVEANRTVQSSSVAATTPAMPVSPTISVPTAAPGVVAPSSGSGAGRAIVFVLISIIILASAGAGYAFYKKIGPFAAAQYIEATFVSDILAKVSNIDTASYVVSTKLEVVDREKDAKPFVVSSESLETQQKYKNDAMRIQRISSLISNLNFKYGDRQVYDYKTGVSTVKKGKGYPATLTKEDMAESNYYGRANTDSAEITPFQYKVTEGGRNFEISTTLETPAAIANIRKSYSYVATSTPIDGQNVSFTKDSKYMYIPSSAPKPLLLSLSESLRILSPDVAATIAVGATTDFKNAEFPDWRFTANAEGNFGDLSYKVDAEALKKDKDYYVRINKIPAIISSLSTLKGQWIKITPKASSTNEQGFSKNEFSYVSDSLVKAEATYKEKRTRFAEALKSLALLADKHSLVTFKSKPTSEKVEGRTLTRYELDINKEAIIPFYKEVLSEAEKYKDIEVVRDQGLLDYLNSKDFEETFAFFKENTKLVLWVDGAGFPAILQYQMRVVPPDTATQLKEKQINVLFKLTFADVNKPVKIDVPEGARAAEDILADMEKNRASR